jgi:hypothetical protein
MTEDRSENKISADLKKEKTPHKKFQAQIKFDGVPHTLEIDADSTKVKVREYTKNPKKFSFGTVVAQNKNKVEFYCYPLSSLDHVQMSFHKDFSAKSANFPIDSRRLAEIRAVTRRIGYFMGLSKERKKLYLRKKGFYANINITKGLEC